ncbi:hypothetical protein [Undibacterium sp.]|uniref:hypothetical protein n=1 Tax=Undibacterium sp. TaxID=1914977 RepID=UPI0037505BCE
MSIFFRRIFVSLVISFIQIGVVDASPNNGRENVSSLERLVTSIYKEYAWTILFGVEPRLDAAIPLSQEGIGKLRKVFTDDLAIAISKDAQCANKTREICLLDFDILFDSQDSDARDLSIRSVTEHTVEVCFLDQADLRRCFEFVGVKEKKGERIREIRYDKIGRSLRAILKLKV